MNADGSGLVNLTNHAGDDMQPTWFPDGSKIAFSSNRDGEVAVDPETGKTVPVVKWYIMNSDGSNQERAPVEGGIPDWSPDQRQVVYEKAAGDDQGTWLQIWIVDSDGSSKRLLTLGMTPRWSPSGQSIAFVRYPKGIQTRSPSQLFLIKPTGAAERLLLDSPLIISDFCWSPEGKRIAFAAYDDIYVVDTETAELTRLYAGVFDRCTSWSPDGHWLACERRGDIYAVHVDDSRSIQLTDGPAEDMFPDWAP